MSELYRYLSAEEFESGLESRLLVSELSVGQECAVRFEYIYKKRIPLTLNRIELAVAITALTTIEKGTRVDYIAEYARMQGETGENFDILGVDSIGHSPQNRSHRLYFCTRSTGNWDDELASLVDESLLIAH